jgi:fatty acid desaturase
MNILDPRGEPVPSFISPAARALNDPRDVVFVWLLLRCAGFGLLGVSLFFLPAALLPYAGAGYVVLLFGGLMDRYTLMLHCTSHRPLFKKPYRALNNVIPWFIAPFFGQTPNSYFSHHMGMHHREENLAADLSSTMRFKRDRFDHWLRYYLRFMLGGLLELELYLFRRKQWKLFRRVLVGEAGYFLALAALLFVAPLPTVVVFVVPFVAIRTAMMMGNWAQHSFIKSATPENPYHASITCINTRYNRRCFNDGYHVLHHVKPACHWTEHPAEFERALAEYGRQDSIVFDGIDFFGVWLCLMTRRWARLAEHFVVLEGAPTRTREEVVAFLKDRVLPVAQLLEVPAAVAAE